MLNAKFKINAIFVNIKNCTFCKGLHARKSPDVNACCVDNILLEELGFVGLKNVRLDM